MSLDYARVEKAIRFLDANSARQPELKDVAAEVGMSEYHFQRLFTRWAGVSPKRFLQFVTASRAGELLRTKAALDTSYELGLSSPSRLHDLTVSVQGATPGEIRSGGAGLTIRWGVDETPFGDCLIGITDRGICEMAFVQADGQESALESLSARWPAADLIEDPSKTASVAKRIFGPDRGNLPVPVLLTGTNFQLQVWRALLDIPPGQVTTYGGLARSMGNPTAARAVGGAVGANRVAYLIPCHRVIRGTSGFGGYRWGVERKRVMLAWEALSA